MIMSTMAAGAALAVSMQQMSDDAMAVATATFTSHCVKYTGKGMDAAPACSCGTGVISQRMTEKEFYVIAGLSPYTSDQTAMRGAVQRLVDQGVPAGLIQSAASKTQGSAPQIERICAVLAQPSGQWRVAHEVVNGEMDGVTVSLPVERPSLSGSVETLADEVLDATDSLTPR